MYSHSKNRLSLYGSDVSFTCFFNIFRTESPRPHHLPALSYTYEDVEKKRKKRRKKKKHHHRRHHGDTEEVVSYLPSIYPQHHNFFPIA